jgi:hypothetical protein
MRFSTAYEQDGSRKALDATGICSGSSAHRRFQEWTQAGVFQTLWAQGLLDYDELKGIEWEWQAVDGVMTKAPLGQEQTGPNPTDPRQTWGEAECVSRRPWRPSRSGGRWSQPQ